MLMSIYTKLTENYKKIDYIYKHNQEEYGNMMTDFALFCVFMNKMNNVELPLADTDGNIIKMTTEE